MRKVNAMKTRFIDRPFRVDHEATEALWSCPECGEEAWWNHADVLNGSPTCTECEVDMELKEKPEAFISRKELAAIIELARAAIGDAEIADRLADRKLMDRAEIENLGVKIQGNSRGLLV